jgi:hypothetical protein
VVFVLLFDRADEVNAGVVDQHVDGAEAPLGRPDDVRALVQGSCRSGPIYRAAGWLRRFVRRLPVRPFMLGYLFWAIYSGPFILGHLFWGDFILGPFILGGHLLCRHDLAQPRLRAPDKDGTRTTTGHASRSRTAREQGSAEAVMGW